MGAAAAARPVAPRGVLLLALLAFVSLGLPDTVLGVAWPTLSRDLAVPRAGLGALLVAGAVGYAASSVAAGRLLALGVGRLLALSCGLLVAASAGFALGRSFAWLLPLAVVAGLGAGAIDATLNAYVSTHFPARVVGWLHACYSLGATIGPLVMTAAVVGGGSWRAGYAAVGAAMAALSLVFAATAGRWQTAPAAAEAAAPVSTREALDHPLVRAQALLFFLYVGLELTVGSWCFTLLTEGRGQGASLAGAATSAYFGAIGAGRVLLGLLGERLVGLGPLERLLRGCALAALAGAALYALGPAPLDLAGLLLLGLALGPVFPCLMAVTPLRLGPELARHAFGFQVCAGMVGGALLPGLAGWLGQRLGTEWLALHGLSLAAALVVAHEALLRLAARPPRPDGPR